MIEDIVGNNGTRFIIAAGAVALGLFCLMAVLRFIRNRPSSPFIRGGKNRQPRLAVLDAAAIDTRRRLVLVRRDDVEHLIMIGGPTDVVIESRIAAQAAPQLAATSLPETAATRPTTERRASPQPEPRPETWPETRTAPVSAMGQVLYGESSDQVSTTAARGAPARPQTITSDDGRQSMPERVVTTQPRPQPVASNTIPTVAVERTESPEDILEAARTRVLRDEPASSRAASPDTDNSRVGIANRPADHTEPAGYLQRRIRTYPRRPDHR